MRRFLVLQVILLFVLVKGCQKKSEVATDFTEDGGEILMPEAIEGSSRSDSLIQELSGRVSVLEQEIAETKETLARQQNSLKTLQDSLNAKEAALILRDEILYQEIIKLNRMAKFSYFLIILAGMLLGFAVFLFWRDRSKRRKFGSPTMDDKTSENQNAEIHDAESNNIMKDAVYKD